MDKKKVLVIDRRYNFKYMKSNLFDVQLVCLQLDSKKKHLKEGLDVIACFEEEFDSLPVADIPDNYLIHSFDSDRFLKRFSWEKRQEILGKEISFWQQIFDRFKPDCIVNEVVTIEWMEVMYIEAMRRNIPYYRIALLPFDRYDVWTKNNPFNSRLGKEFWDNIETNKEDREKAQKYISLTRGEGRKPYYIRGQKFYGWGQFLKAIHYYIDSGLKHLLKRKNFLYEDYFFMAKNRVNALWCKFLYHQYDKLEQKQDVEYLFYPIHFEPEATIEYFSFFFNDQEMMIGRLAHSLKTNQKLIIKEHPQQPGILMTKRFRRLKKKYSNLLFIPGEVSSYDIYPHIKCIITLSGTAGFESWVCKRPVIEFGEVYYSDLPGIIKCESFKQLYDIIRNNRYTVADDDVILDYVAKMYHVMVEAIPVMLNGKLDQHDCNLITKQVEELLNKQ